MLSLLLLVKWVLSHLKKKGWWCKVWKMVFPGGFGRLCLILSSLFSCRDEVHQVV